VATGDTVLVIGAGLVGTSLGLALTEHGYRVFLQDLTSSHALVAAGLGAGSVESPDHVDIVVVAVPPTMTGPVVVDALRAHPGATVTDVASVKAPIMAHVRHAGADVSRYIGSHPMAGSQRSGPLTARSDLFVDRTWVIIVDEDQEPARRAQVERMALVSGAHVEHMDSLEHDQAVAEVSHVPQILSSLMAGNLRGVLPSHLRLAGQGVRDVTRIAASDVAMWTQIITANHEAISAQLAILNEAWDRVRTHLDSPDAVAAFLASGNDGARALPGKHGRTPHDYQFVVVEIPDSPGALARLFADIDAVGVNVEDLRIEHDRAREVGYMSIAVDPERVDGLEQAIRDAGWTLRA